MRNRRFLAFVALLTASTAVGYWFLCPGQAAPILGTVRATEIPLAPEVGGQLATVRTSQGEAVHTGDILAQLLAVELSATVAQAHAALDAAVADRNNVYAGVRAEQVAAMAAEIGKAKSRLKYAEQQRGRADYLVRTNTSSQQVLDQATNDVAAAQADVAEARANYDAAVAGPTKEERATADAQVHFAAAALAVLQRRLEKTVLRAPVDGIVSVIVAEVGENVRVGQPVLTIREAGKQFLSFNVREDLLRGITVGSAVRVMRAGSFEETPTLVTELEPLGTFATWQAERAVGDHDRNTLRLRLDFKGDATLEPGMSVWIPR